jgi:hypothetical protein
MQPYLLPYIGYYQLIGAVDLFIVYDNIKYTKKGWINRNRMLQNGSDVMFTLPLAAGSDSLDVCERRVAPDFDGTRLLNQIAANYRRAPHFEAAFALAETIFRHPERNLFDFLLHGLAASCARLDLATPLRRSSSIDIDHTLAGQDKVVALCEAVGATRYINAIGGRALYRQDAFGPIALRFLQAQPFDYPQFGAPFVPWLSMLDVMMFNPAERIRAALAGGYTLLDPLETH